MEKYGVEKVPEKKDGEKTASSGECQHKVIRAEGQGKERVYFCMQCNKYITNLGGT